MNPAIELPLPRSRPNHPLLRTLAMTVAALAAAAVLFVGGLYANVVPPFHQQITLSRSQSLEIGVVPSCPPSMSEMACLHVADQFPHTFKIVYWSDGTAYTITSMVIPRR